MEKGQKGGPFGCVFIIYMSYNGQEQEPQQEQEQPPQTNNNNNNDGIIKLCI